MSFFLCIIPAPITKIPITLALTTDGESPVISIYIINNIIVINLVFLFPMLGLKSKLIPIIIYETCIPETAKICEILLILNLSCVSSSISELSPNKMPFIILVVY